MTGKDQKEAKGLTERQIKAIPHLVVSSSYEEGRKAARISKNTLYTWLRDPTFKDELKKQRNTVVDEAFESLKASVTRAVDVLSRLLNSQNESMQRYAANDILNYVMKVKELADIEDRLSSIERIVLEKRTYR
ncbi:MAG: hypothetical protein AB1711_08010 [Thermodesulfobacteriota bacterium]